jgi:hypothetical protein
MNTPKRFTQRPRRKRKERGAAGAPKRLGPRPSTGSRSVPDDPPFLKFWKRNNDTLPKRIGEAHLSTLNSALRVLFNRLREARAQFEQEPDNGRRGAFTALGAFHMFITLFRNPRKEALHVPIVVLQDALAGLDEGRTEPIVKAVRRRGRAPSSHVYKSLKGHAAATVKLLLQAGLRRDDAHRAVARQLSQHGVLPERGSGTLTAITVRNWCDEVSSDFGRLGPAAWMYDYKLAPEVWESFSVLPKDRARQFALQKLATYVRSICPKRQKPT